MNYYVTRQLSKAIDRLREDLREAFQKQTSAVEDSARASNEERREIPRIIASAIETAAKDIPTHEKSQRDKEYRQQNRLILATWCAFAAAFIYAAIAAFQLHQMKRANDLTKQALANGNQALSETLAEMQGQIDQMSRLADNAKSEADRTKDLAATAAGQLKEIKSTDRAFIFVPSVSAVASKGADGSPGFVTFFSWQNSGSTTTKNLQIESNVGPAKQFGPSFAFTFPIGSKRIPTMIGPKSEETIWTSVADYAYIIRSIYTTNGGWYAYGRATYNDVFGKGHLTEFCWQAAPATVSPEKMDYYPCVDPNSKYNCSDRECEDYKKYIK